MFSVFCVVVCGFLVFWGGSMGGFNVVFLCLEFGYSFGGCRKVVVVVILVFCLVVLLLLVRD